jgi:hypothetical protein
MAEAGKVADAEGVGFNQQINCIEPQEMLFT